MYFRVVVVFPSKFEQFTFCREADEKSLCIWFTFAVYNKH